MAQNKPTALRAEHANVLLDALNAFGAQIDNGSTPWNDYDTGSGPLSVKEQYLALLDEAGETLNTVVDTDGVLDPDA